MIEKFVRIILSTNKNTKPSKKTPIQICLEQLHKFVYYFSFTFFLNETDSLYSISCLFLFLFVIFRDSVEWDTEQEEAAQQKINENSRVKLGEDQQSILPS